MNTEERILFTSRDLLFFVGGIRRTLDEIELIFLENQLRIKKKSKGKISKNLDLYSSFKEEKKNENVALAWWSTKDGQLGKYYFSINKINDENDLSKEVKELLNKMSVSVCYRKEVEDLTVWRLHTKNLKFYKPEIKGFAGEKNNCCERKIIAGIRKELIDNEGNLDKLNESSLSLYTKLEPCIYCFRALQELMEEYKVSIELFYFEQVNQIIADLEDKPTFIERAAMKKESELYLKLQNELRLDLIHSIKELIIKRT